MSLLTSLFSKISTNTESMSAKRLWLVALFFSNTLSCFANAEQKNHLVDLSKLPPEISKDYLTGKSTTEELSMEALDDLIRKIQLSPNLDSVKAIEESGKIVLHIKRTQKIKTVKLSGLSYFSDYDAKQFFGVNVNDPFDQQALIDGGERLRLAYKDAGYLNAIVNIELPPTADGNLEVHVTVTENRATEISNIAVTSTNKELNQDLQSAVKSFKGKALTDANVTEIQKDLKEFLLKKRFMKAEVSGPITQYNSDESKAELFFRVERPEKYTVQFEGNKYFLNREIESELDLNRFSTSSPNIASELAGKLRTLYLNKGFARVEILADEDLGRDPTEKVIRLTIDEGPRVKIDKVEIQGRFQRPADYYTRFVLNNSSDLVSNGYYNKDDLDSGIKTLTNNMQNDGYLLAKVVSTRVQYTPKKDRITLFINLDEGPLTEIEGVEFEGNFFATDAALLEISEIAKSGPLKLNSIEKALQYVKQYYRDNGFIEMTILNEKEDLVIYNESNTKARLNFKISEGPKVKVGSIVIEGNNFTKESVINTELDFEVGEILTPTKIEESLSRLQRTNYFGSVEIKTLEEHTSVSNRTVIVRVTERDPGIFNMGLGATNERNLTLRGYLGIAYRNIAGTGRQVSMRIEGNYNVTDIRYLESKITIGYLEPYLLGTRNKGRINVSRSKTVTDFSIRQGSEVNQTNLTVERDFTSHLLGVLQVWGLATVRDFSISSSNYFPETLTDIATIGPSFDLDYRDNIFNPTTGTFTHVAYEYSSPDLGSTSTINYYKTTASFTHYKKLNDKPWVWANNVRFGYLENLSRLPTGGVPWDKVGFILGGRSTVRGFEAGTNEVFPNSTDLGTSKYYLTTQSRMYLLKSEIRFPIYGNFAGAVFYDGGAVLIDGLNFKDPYRDAAGFGLRYNTPVGPLNLEFGWKLDRKDGEEPWRFHLSIGAF